MLANCIHNFAKSYTDSSFSYPLPKIFIVLKTYLFKCHYQFGDILLDHYLRNYIHKLKCHKRCSMCQLWWSTWANLVLGRLRQEGYEFKTSLRPSISLKKRYHNSNNNNNKLCTCIFSYWRSNFQHFGKLISKKHKTKLEYSFDNSTFSKNDICR
jgi:hypothetical protein